MDMIRARRRAESLAQAASFLCRSLVQFDSNDILRVNTFASVIARNFAHCVEINGDGHNVALTGVKQPANSSVGQELTSRSWAMTREGADNVHVCISAPLALLDAEGGRHSVTLDLLVNVLALSMGRRCEAERHPHTKSHDAF
jgi:hypothetical protein